MRVLIALAAQRMTRPRFHTNHTCVLTILPAGIKRNKVAERFEIVCLSNASQRLFSVFINLESLTKKFSNKQF